jgi:hypothetical protein
MHFPNLLHQRSLVGGYVLHRRSPPLNIGRACNGMVVY